MRSPEQTARQEQPSKAKHEHGESLAENKEGSGVRERPISAEETVHKFLFDSQQFGDEAKMLANELPKFQKQGIMTEQGLRNYQTRLTSLVEYLKQAVAYGENVVRSGASLRSMDQLRDGIVHNQEIIARAQEALAESTRQEEWAKQPPVKELFKEPDRSASMKREASPWTRQQAKEKTQQPKKSIWSRFNPKKWFSTK